MASFFNLTAAQQKRLDRRDSGVTPAQNALGYLLKKFFDKQDAEGTYTKIVTATLAEINAGKVLIAAVDGFSIIPLHYAMKVAGAFAAGTNIKLQDDADTPVVVTTALTAALTDGAKINGDSTVTNVTNGAGYWAALTASKNLKVVKTGDDFTGGTSITFKITYRLA